MSTILIADSSRLLQRNLTLTLQGAGYDLLLASDGVETLSLCSKRIPDLMILDVGLAGVNSREVMRLLRSNPGLTDMPVLLMANDERALRPFNAVGFQDQIFKPIETRQLLTKVHALLAPLPNVGQSFTLQHGEKPLQCTVARSLPGRGIYVPYVWGMDLKPSQLLTVSYDAAGGVRITRDAAVQNVNSDGATLVLGPNISVEQRRRHFRKDAFIPVRYRLPGDFYRLAQTLDLSGGGMRITGMGGNIEEGMRIDFQLVLDPSVVLMVQGVIRRIIMPPTGSHEVGIEFQAIDPRVQQELTMFLFAGLPMVE